MPQAAKAKIGPRRRRRPVWARLWVSVVTTNLAGCAFAVYATALIRAIPSSSAVESTLLFAYYMAMAVVALVDALLVDELVFDGAFRRSMWHGESTPSLKHDDVEVVAASMKRSSMGFAVVVIGCGLITYLLFNWVNRDFDREYRRIGRHLSALVHADEAGKIAAIQQLANIRATTGDAVPPIVRALQDTMAKGGEPGRWAAWSMGRYFDQKLRRPFVGPLVAAARAGDPGIRREAVIALARLQHRSSAEMVQAEVRADLEAGRPVDLRLLYALGSVQVMSSIDVLETLLHAGDERTQGLAAWAMAQHRDEAGGRTVVPKLEQRLATASAPVRCDILHALTILADERSNVALMRVYDDATAEERSIVCPNFRLSLRPDGSIEDRVDLFMPESGFALRVIHAMAQMRATSPDVRREVEPWLEGFIAAAETEAEAREAAKILLAGIRQQRDDSKALTIEQALGRP